MSDMKNILLNDESQKGTFFAQNFDKLEINRYFTGEGVHPYDEIKWERRVARITSAKGETGFEQKDVETPKFWSQTATDIVAEKYFSGHVGKPGREYSVRQLIDRVADTITTNGKEAGYFSTEKDAEAFNHELKYLLVNQKAAFNSPVWFNVGVEKRNDDIFRRFWSRHQPFRTAFFQGKHFQPREVFRTGIFYERGGRYRWYHQIWWQNETCRKNGHIEYRPPGRKTIHRL